MAASRMSIHIAGLHTMTQECASEVDNLFHAEAVLAKQCDDHAHFENSL